MARFRANIDVSSLDGASCFKLNAAAAYDSAATQSSAGDVNATASPT